MFDILLNCERTFIPKAQYVLETFLTYYPVRHRFIDRLEDKDPNRPLLAYTTTNISSVVRGPNLLFIQSPETAAFFRSGKRVSSDQIKSLASGGSLFHCQASNDSRTPESDVIASAFYFLSAWQEVHSHALDSKGRFPASASVQAMAGKLQVPVVDLWFDTLAARIRDMGIEIKRVGLPGGARHVLSLSHDIDYVSRGLGYASRQTLNQAYRTVKRIKQPSGSSIGTIRFIPFRQREILEKMRRTVFGAGCASTFNLLASYEGSNDAAVKRISKILDGSTFEVGLHATMDMFQSSIGREAVEEFCSRYQLKNLHGLRIHELAFRPIDLYKALEPIERLAYDQSMMFADAPGYRTGFSLPHQLFLPEENRPTRCLSIPLVAMDTTFEKYMSLSEPEAEAAMGVLLQRARESGGLMSLLIHNSFFFSRTGRRLEIFEQWLKQTVESGGAVVPTRRLLFWWQELTRNSKALQWN